MKSFRSICAGISGERERQRGGVARGSNELFHGFVAAEARTSVSAPASPETAVAGTPENATSARWASSTIFASARGDPDEPPVDMVARTAQISVSD